MKKTGSSGSISKISTARGVHDLGGLPAGQVDTHEHVPTLTERRIDAMMGLLRDNKRHLWKTDENRRTIESMTPQMYEGTAYYERWVLAMRSLLVEKGVLSEDEIAKRLNEVRARRHNLTEPSTTGSDGTDATAAKTPKSTAPSSSSARGGAKNKPVGKGRA